jgi:hypothetical protein
VFDEHQGNEDTGPAEPRTQGDATDADVVRGSRLTTNEKTTITRDQTAKPMRRSTSDRG